MREHDFTQKVKDEIARKAMYICSNPYCLCVTGYTTTEGKARSIAEGAHVLPSGDGPRESSRSKYSDIDLSSSANGLWLCSNCHDKVDEDEQFYTPELLFQWKENIERITRNLVGKGLEAALLSLRNERQYHDECREFLSFIESRRVLYEAFDAESPPRVLQSLELIRERINQTRARVNPDSGLFNALNTLQDAVNRFLRSVGNDVNLNDLRCDSRDQKWCEFTRQLGGFRSEFIVIVQRLSASADYKLTWL